MRYDNIQAGIFIDRPNRFIAHIEIDGKVELCHVKNTGRCKELLTAGAKVLVQGRERPGRKTGYDLISAWKGDRLVNVDSQVPNQLFREWVRSGGLFPELTLLKGEYKYGSSRFDFYVEAGSRKILVEVKGVTLEQDGAAFFPDAPTERGVKHLKELAACLDHGYEAMVAFIIQMKGVRYLSPNDRTHPQFGTALRELSAKGAKILAVDCLVTENTITAHSPVEVRL